MNKRKIDLDLAKRSTPRWRIADLSVVFAMVVLLIFANVSVIMLASTPDYFGVRLAANPGGSGVLVTRVIPNSPAEQAGVSNGEVLSRLQSFDGERYELTDLVALIDPTFSGSTERYQRFFALRDDIRAIASQPSFQIATNDGRMIVVEMANRRPLPALLSDDRFIAPLIFGNIAIVSGFLFWVFGRHRIVLRLLFAMSAFTASLLWTAAIAWVQDFGFSQSWSHTVYAFNQLSTCLTCLTLLTILLTYPTRLIGWRMFGAMVVVSLIYWASYVFGLLSMPPTAMLWYYLAMTVAAFVVIVVQFHATRRSPLERAQAGLIALCVMALAAAILGVYVIPVLITGQSLGGEIWLSSLVTVLPLIAFGVAIARYKLFDLPQWWFRVSVWLTTGVLIIALELGLFYYIGLRHGMSLAIATLATAFIYFPLRQAMFRRFFSVGSKSTEDILPRYMNQLTGIRSSTEFNECLTRQCETLFSPGHIGLRQSSEAAAAIVDNGLALEFPGAQSGERIRMEAAARATRLFNSFDLKIAKLLSEVTRQFYNQTNAVQTGVLEERSRIARDLHDTVGAKLVGLMHSQRHPEQAQDARDVTSALKDAIWLLRQEQPQSLRLAIAKWCEEARVRCDAFGVALEWTQATFDDRHVKGQWLVNCGNILREALTNALKHSRPSSIGVVMQLTAECELQIYVEHDGSPSKPENWVEGNGLRGMTERVKELGGSHSWSADNDRAGQVQLVVRIPVPQQSLEEDG